MGNDLWQPTSEGVVRESVKRAKVLARQGIDQEYALAVDYLHNRQRVDVEAELRSRFPSSAGVDSGQQMYPVTIPLTERYVAEMATAYNHSVTRTLLDASGEETDETKRLTADYNRALDAAQYDEVMHETERMTVLLGTSITWHQYRRGKLRVTTAYPHETWPVMIENHVGSDPGDADDYLGFVIECFYARGSVTTAQKRIYAYVTADEIVYYTGGDPHDMRDIVGQYANPYRWPQVGPGDELVRNPTPRDLPILPLTFWQRSKSTQQLICDADPDIVYANRELNIMWSVLFDTIRFQGFDTPVINRLDARNPKRPVQRHGARFPVDLMVGESFAYAAASHNYTEMVDVLMRYAKLIAVNKRLSPNDISIDGQVPASGWAKFIDSLPKIEARDERIRRLVHVEQEVAWPRNAAILAWSGILPESVKQLKCRVKFADVEFPQSPDERQKEAEFDLKNNLTTRAKLLADRMGIGIEAARAALAENEAENGRQSPAADARPGDQDTGSLLGRLIGRKRPLRGDDDDER